MLKHWAILKHPSGLKLLMTTLVVPSVTAISAWVNWLWAPYSSSIRRIVTGLGRNNRLRVAMVLDFNRDYGIASKWQWIFLENGHGTL